MINNYIAYISSLAAKIIFTGKISFLIDVQLSLSRVYRNSNLSWVVLVGF